VTIEEYLDELRQHLRVGPLARRRIVREIEGHLIEAAADRGEDAAIAELGSPRLLARRFSDDRRPPQRGRLIGVSVLVAAAIVIPVLVFTGGTAPQLKGPIGDGSIAALDHNPAKPEFVPASDIVASDKGQRVLSDSKRTLWVAPGKGRSTVCLVIEEDSGDLGAVCAGRTVLLRGPIYSAFQQDRQSPISIVGVVDDAVTAVQAPTGETFHVRDNAFAFDGIPPSSRSIELKLFTATGTRTFSIRTGPGPRQVAS
jgi:hypothetical protein